MTDEALIAQLKLFLAAQGESDFRIEFRRVINHQGLRACLIFENEHAALPWLSHFRDADDLLAKVETFANRQPAKT